MVDKTTLFMLADLACRCSKRQRLFAETHVLQPLRPIDEVAQAAGYGGGSAQQAARLLNNPKVRAYVDALLQASRGEDRTGRELAPVVMGAREAQELLARVARSSVADHLTRDETGRVTATMNLDNAYGIKSVKVHEWVDPLGNLHTETQFQMEDRIRALELICRALGLFLDDDKAKRKDQALEMLWRAYLAEHPEEAKRIHLQLLAFDSDQPFGKIIDVGGRNLPVPVNGDGAPA